MSALKKILMVDDDADLREALADQLVATEEFDVFEAGDGEAGLARARDEHYDLVILDVGLPDMDGRELCRLMRKQGVKCPILIMCGPGDILWPWFGAAKAARPDARAIELPGGAYVCDDHPDAVVDALLAFQATLA